MKLLLELIDSAFKSIGNSIDGTFERDHEVRASFGRANDLISKNNSGWCIDGKRFLDMETSRKNLAVIAGSGKFKTQTHIFPLLLNLRNSAVVNDNSGELSQTIPYLESTGINTAVLDLTKKSGVYINPLDGCKGDITAVRKISKSLMGFASKEKDFFSVSGEDCLSLFIEHVVESEPKVFANLGNAYRLILEYQGSPQTVEAYMADRASSSTWKKFLALAGNSERTLKSITATSLSALSWLGENPVLADITSVTNIRLENFRKSPHVLFIQSPVSDAQFFSPMVSLVLNSFYRFVFSHLPDPNEDLDIMMVLDEFSSLIPGLPDYSQIISNSRKFLTPQCIVLQDESLLSPYKELKDNILQNCFVKCYHGASGKKAMELEKSLGSYSYEERKTKKKITRPLMTTQEIQQMDGEALVLVNGKQPLKVKVTPAFRQSRLRKRLGLQPCPEGSDIPIPEYGIQYIDLEPYRNTQNSKK